MEDLADALPGADRVFWYESGPGGRPGRIDLTGVEVPGDAVGYLCGPLEFMRDARERLIRAGVAARDIHYEVFGPDLWLPAA